MLGILAEQKPLDLVIGARDVSDVLFDLALLPFSGQFAPGKMCAVARFISSIISFDYNVQKEYSS